MPQVLTLRLAELLHGLEPGPKVLLGLIWSSLIGLSLRVPPLLEVDQSPIQVAHHCGVQQHQVCEEWAQVGDGYLDDTHVLWPLLHTLGVHFQSDKLRVPSVMSSSLLKE